MTRAFYLDHNATSPADPRVVARFLEVDRDCPGNPASIHAPGRHARAVVENSRVQAADALGVDPGDLLFTSGGTEANNCAVLGLGDANLPVLLAPTEHPSVVEPARSRGVVEWAVDDSGCALVQPVDVPVGLVCLTHAQSEVGTMQPIVVAAELANDLQVPLHVDAAQTLGRVPLHEVLQRADSVAFSPHKAGGLRGGGLLFVRNAQQRLRPLLRGGGQQAGLRPGTVSPAMAAASALCVALAVAEQAERKKCMETARRAFLEQLCDSTMRILTPLQKSLPNTVMLAFDNLEGRSLLPALDLEGIAVSQGSACSAGTPQPPVILAAMGVEERVARACVRLSFGRSDDSAFAGTAGKHFANVVARLQNKK
ncbi:MAG: aminotransferase class V-fold PLP-dependent enzyme [Planctomycetota bacterium]|nr:aminotransferase class V-fold PLP-dependent enzyme [Planctomycetota bacterium]